MTDAPKSHILINGQRYETAALQAPASGRLFREAWADPQDSVIQIDLPKARKIAHGRIKEWREKRETAGFEFKDKIIQSDQRSSDRILGAARMADKQGAKFSIEWKAADNSLVKLNKKGMGDMFAALAQHVQTVFSDAEAKKAEIDAAASADEIKTILEGLE